MTIETKCEYIYHTIIDSEQWRRGNEDIWGADGFTWENACKFISTKFEKIRDGNTCFKVSDAHYCDDIEHWRRANERHKMCPVFVQFQDDQQIMTTGEGCLFVLYEADYAEDEEDAYITGPDEDNYENLYDGLAGAGGRL